MKMLKSNTMMNDNSMPYSLPEGYFDQLQKRMASKLANTPAGSDEVHVDFLATENPSSIPPNYFSNMQSDVLSKITNADVTEPSIDLVSQESYRTPEKYFEKPPVVRKSRRNVPLYSGYSILTNIAATFLILITIGALYIKPSNNTNSQNFNMEGIQESEWKDYLAAEGDLNMSQGTNPVVNLDYISKKEVNEFLKEEEEYLDIF